MTHFAPSIREVWAWNLQPELHALQRTIHDAGPGAVIATSLASSALHRQTLHLKFDRTRVPDYSSIPSRRA